MEKIFTKENSTEAIVKIFEFDEETPNVKKSNKKKVFAKGLRAKRRKANAKEKNCRRKLGTRYGDNPYRGKPGDYIHDYHLYERHGKLDKLEHDRKKLEKEYEFEVERNTENIEDLIPETIYESDKLTLVECVEKSEWGLLLFKLINKYPRDKVIEMLKSLEEANA